MMGPLTPKIMRNRSILCSIWVALFIAVLTILVVVPVDAFAFRSHRGTSRSINSYIKEEVYNSVQDTRNRWWIRCNNLCAVVASDNNNDVGVSTAAVGLYKKFADHALEKLLETQWVVEDKSVPLDLSEKEAPAKGTKNESIVRITTKALIPKTKNQSRNLIRYARITLLETVPILDDNNNDGIISPDGIQVLNFVVLPNLDSTLPVMGIDLVSLPGSKHLLLMDAQPMAIPNPHENHWEDWYRAHVVVQSSSKSKSENKQQEEREQEEILKFSWGGDFPESVKQYVSKYALWTRLQDIIPVENNDDNDTPSAIDIIQSDIFLAFQRHLDTYLKLLGQYTTALDNDNDDENKNSNNNDNNIETVKGDNHQPSYLDYRRNNDPAKPMLNALYGKEWTQTLLDNVLFPQD
mmetsp:Transcript_25274/g.25607  ORF Transcript_25274/g.25607 Transcript_25274/m.25607 type:complete len:408 (-) Transcript_25274:730-1953(-)